MAKKKKQSRKKRSLKLSKRRQDKRSKQSSEAVTYGLLEPRQLLAAIVVTASSDVSANDGVTTLREAIEIANSNGVGQDTITFSSAIAGETITLTQGELRIAGGFNPDVLTIDATSVGRVTIDADEESRIFNVTGPFFSAGNNDVTSARHTLNLTNLTLTGGAEAADNDLESDLFNNFNSGGAIRFNSTGTLTLDNSRVVDNLTIGEGASGGGIFAIGDVVLTNNTLIEGNSTGIKLQAGLPFQLLGSAFQLIADAGTLALGGGVYSRGDVSVINSTVNSNRTFGETAPGGGIAARGTVTLTNSDVTNNYTDGFYAYGGGVYAGGVVPNPAFFAGNGLDRFIPATGKINVLAGSTVSGNEAKLRHSKGGGLFGFNVDVVDSTISNNSTGSRLSHGGGIYAHNTLTLDNSTLSGNTTEGGVSIAEALLCSLGTWVAKEAVKNLPVIGQVYGVFSQIQGYIDIINIFPGIDIPQIDLNPCPDFGSGSMGGGAFAADIRITNSDITGNSTDGHSAHGGALKARKSLVLTNSLVSGNSTNAQGSLGGAIDAHYALINNSLIEDNKTTSTTSGGGAVNAHRADVNNSVIRDNETDGLRSPGGAFLVDQLNVNHSLVIGNFTSGRISPGGAFDAKTASINQSQLIGNHTLGGDRILGPESSPGGAINAGRVISNDSTFSGNYTKGDEAHGGAIAASDVDSLRSTFFGNFTEDSEANGGAIYIGNVFQGNQFDGAVHLNQTTLSGNTAGNKGGGVFSSDLLILENSILLENAAVNDADGSNRGNEFHTEILVANSKNVVGESANTAIDRVVVQSSTGTALTSGNPVSVFDNTTLVSHGGVSHLTGTLADNGGVRAGGTSAIVGQSQSPLISQIVETIDLEGSSFNVALDAVTLVSAAPLQFDQRGFQRGFDFGNNNGGLDDLGAVEKRFSSVVDTTLFDDGGASTTTLSEAIENANSAPNTEITITFAPELSGETLQLFDELPVLLSNLVIDASSLSERIIIRASGSDRILDVRSPDYLTLKSLELTNGNISGTSTFSGGAINVQFSPTLTLVNSFVHDNSTSGESARGGAIFGNNAEVVLIDSEVSDNHTSGKFADGGGIFAEDVKLYNSIVRDNETRYADTNGIGGAKGGGIYSETLVGVYDGSYIGSNSTRSENGNGGGIYAGNVKIVNSTIKQNETQGENADGGGVFAKFGIEATGSDISENKTLLLGSAGGGLYADSLTISNSEISENGTLGTTNSPGGGLFARDEATVSDSVITDNFTVGNYSRGGGLYVGIAGGSGTGIANVRNNTIGLNTTAGFLSEGGGVFADDLHLTNSTVSGNSVAFSNYGGGVFGNTVTSTNSIVLGNHSRFAFDDEIGVSPGQPLTFIGRNIVGESPSFFDTTNHAPFVQNALVTDVFQDTFTISVDSDGDGVRDASIGRLFGLPSGIGRESIELVANASNPAIDGTVAPVSVFSFEGNADDGFGNNSGFLASGLTADSEGIRGNAIEFTGNENEFVELNNPLTIGDKSHTVELWVKVPEVGDGDLSAGERVGEILGNFSSGINANWGILADGQIQIFWNNGQVRLRGNQDLRDGQWHHLSFVRDTAADEFRAYIDGEVELLNGAGGNINQAGTDITFTTDHRIGQDTRGSGRVPFHGFIDELTIHEQALTDEEIKIRATRFDGRGEGFDRIAVGPNPTVTSSPAHLDIGVFESPVVEIDSLIVTTLEDVVDPTDQQTSLREAIAFANSGDADGVSGLEDTILFDASLSGGKIVLTNGQLEITEALKIAGDSTSGAASEITIDADKNSRAIHFSATTGNLDLFGLHLTNGLVSDDDGGAVRFDSSGEITLRRSRVSGSAVVGDNATGGGIHSEGSVRLLYATVDGNTTNGNNSGGAGVFAATTTRLLNATVHGNESYGANSPGGGVMATSIVSTNSTISGNSTRGIGSDGGGLYGSSSVRLTNSILLGNSTLGAGVGEEELNAGSTFNAFYGQNIVGENSSDFDVAGSSFSNAVQNADIEKVFLSTTLPLTTEFIPTMGLRPIASNPAIDSGDDARTNLANLNLDARLNLRIVDLGTIAGSGVDLGAYELQADVEEIRSTVVTTTSDTVDQFDYRTSLREAVAYAIDLGAETSIPNTITFADGVGELFAQPQTIGLTEQLPKITSDILILGTGQSQLTIDVFGNDRIFEFGSEEEGTFVVKDLTLRGGEVLTDGGAILLNDPDDRLIIDSVRFTENFANGGGAISVTNSDLEVYNSSFVGNGANFSGSAIHFLGDATGWIANSTFSSNVSITSGFGAITVQAGDSQVTQLDLRNVTVAENIGRGLQIFAGAGGSGEIRIGNSIVADNSLGNVVTFGSGVELFTSLGNNISDDGTGNFSAAGDFTNTDPLLDAFDFGDTWHYPLLSNSDAIDAGNNALAVDADGVPLATDQRGGEFIRVRDGNSDGTETVDIGAFEFESQFLLGDVDLNGVVNFLDIAPFISVLSNNLFQAEADIDQNGVVNFLDISPFIGILSSQGGTQLSVASVMSAASNLTPVTSNPVSVESDETPAIQSQPTPKVEREKGNTSSIQRQSKPAIVTLEQHDAIEPALLADLGGGPAQGEIGSLTLRNDSSDYKVTPPPKTKQLSQRVESSGASNRSSSSLDADQRERLESSSAALFDVQPEILDELTDFEFETTIELETFDELALGWK